MENVKCQICGKPAKFTMVDAEGYSGIILEDHQRGIEIVIYKKDDDTDIHVCSKKHLKDVIDLAFERLSKKQDDDWYLHQQEPHSRDLCDRCSRGR